MHMQCSYEYLHQLVSNMQGKSAALRVCFLFLVLHYTGQKKLTAEVVLIR